MINQLYDSLYTIVLYYSSRFNLYLILLLINNETSMDLISTNDKH